MPDDLTKQFEKALQERGNALAVGMGFTVGDYVGAADANIEVVATLTTPPGQKPEGLPKSGILLIHSGTLVTPREDTFRLGWFLGESLKGLLTQTAGDPSALGGKIDGLANELSDIVATDKYTLESSEGKLSEDLWNDYLGGTLPPEIMWLRFKLTGLESGDEDLWLAHPYCVLERMFGPNQGAKPKAEPASPPASRPPSSEPPPPVAPEVAKPPAVGPSASIRRLLRTNVPLIVTLADKRLATGKLLDIGPGSIIEFERPCDEPLQLSVNNLPIGVGEAVKIGDHFGLKVTAILSPEERAARLIEKWRE